MPCWKIVSCRFIPMYELHRTRKLFSLSSSGTCSMCGEGSIPKTDRSGCDVCPVGTFSKSGADKCTPCAAGTFASTSGTGTCQACSQGTASPTGATVCCGAGTYYSFKDKKCNPCPLDFYNSAPSTVTANVTSCAACPGIYKLGVTRKIGGWRLFYIQNYLFL